MAAQPVSSEQVQKDTQLILGLDETADVKLFAKKKKKKKKNMLVRDAFCFEWWYS